MTMIGIDNSFSLTVCLTVVILVVSRECTGSSHPGVSVHLSHRDRKMNMQYFNDLRRDIGAADMNEITWDTTMAKEARRFGRSCSFEKSPRNWYSTSLYKQLFDHTARPGEIIMNAIRFWGIQKSNFTRFGWQSCEKRNTCEYIKMVSATLEKAACSLTRCSRMRNQREDEEANMYFAVCLFSPTTVITRPPYSPGRKCSRCPLYSRCRRGLCSASGSRFRNNSRSSSRDMNRIVPSYKGDKPSLSKGSVLRGHRYLDEKGNIRIRQLPKYLAQKARRPSYIYRPTNTRSRIQRRPSPSSQTSSQRAAPTFERRRPAQSARVKRQTGSNDHRYQLILRQREEQRRREERERLEREHRRQMLAQQLRQRAAEVRKNEEEDRRAQEQRRRLEDLRRQREEDRRVQMELRRRREEERRRRQRQRELEQQRRPSRPARIESTMKSTDKFQLTQVHNTLRGTGLGELKWSKHLERWARYVVRCEIEYPGPIDTFTNFGKLDKPSQVYNLVYDWGAEGNDVSRPLAYGCRTPDDRERCNHNVIIRNPFIRNFACASLDCVDKTQLTCIYK
ncbi:uncharacterized protein LOC125672284 isoform X2 [Ostrea edulis]|uniref:uncharacterized protein LOC125672284 isoform X2 n=1 Tax=Ostrea edulis TaxID=37623 RepID=UPI0020956782|nr:uncharacterized protein LOC125672284 isoform X2 [Ostrea edulis]